LEGANGYKAGQAKGAAIIFKNDFKLGENHKRWVIHKDGDGCRGLTGEINTCTTCDAGAKKLEKSPDSSAETYTQNRNDFPPLRIYSGTKVANLENVFWNEYKPDIPLYWNFNSSLDRVSGTIVYPCEGSAVIEAVPGFLAQA
jgi:hypothetical protein